MEIKYQVATSFNQIIELHKQIFNEDNQTFFNNLQTKNYYKTFVATHKNNVIAYCIISEIAGEAELINIATVANFRKTSVATNLLNFALKNITAEVVFLEVSQTNIPAIKLYTKCGFINYGIRKNYYGDNDAILMKKQMN